jgi:hypothetical protein
MTKTARGSKKKAAAATALLRAFAAAVVTAIIVSATAVLVGAAGGGPGGGGLVESSAQGPSGTPASNNHSTTTAANAPGAIAAVDGFVKWFQAHGGWMHPQLSLVQVPSFGGWGLVSEVTMAAHTPILVVPASVILTRDRATRELLALVQHRSSNNQPSHLASTLDQMEDVEAMAMYLWTESCRDAAAAFWNPYLRLALPDELPPLLFAMDDRAIELLGDDGLQQLARHTSSRVEALWKQFRPLLVEPPSTSLPTSACDASLEGLRKYVAFVMSHGMSVGDSQIILVPMADMINHNPIPTTAPSNGDNEEVQQPTFDFQQFHDLHGNGSMTVTTDQATIPVTVVDMRSEGGEECLAGEAATNRGAGPGAASAECQLEPERSRYRHTVVEQYSEVDNSLYLEKFGFVPDRNDHHCVLLTMFAAEEHVTPADACVKANGRLPTVRASSDPYHEIQAILELLRGGVGSPPTESSTGVETRIEKHEYESLQRCFRNAMNSNDQRKDDLTAAADRLSCDEAVVWQVWRRLVKRAAGDRLADLHRRQQRQLTNRASLSESIPTQDQLAMKFVQSDIDVLRSLAQLDDEPSSACLWC